jgi:hypothetical protein
MKPIALATLICLLSMNCSIGLSAQDQKSATELKGSSGWEHVSRIPANSKITVHLLDGTTTKGKFVQADADSLTLLTKGNTQSKLRRDEIQRIRRKSAATGALIGTAVGVAGGAGVGAAARGGDMSRAATAGIGSVLFGLGGALVGGVIGIDRTYWENPSPRVQPRP